MKPGQAVADLAAELQMTSKARTVFKVVMETLQQHYAKDKDEYQLVANKIYKALKDKY